MPRDLSVPAFATTLAVGLVAVAVSSASAPALAATGITRFATVTVSPGGRYLAAIEAQGDNARRLVLHDRDGHARAVPVSCAVTAVPCDPASPAWVAPDALAFLVGARTGLGQSLIERVDIGNDAVRVIARFDGPLDGLRAGPDGELAVLATAHAHKRPGATSAAAGPAGSIGGDGDEQRIAVLGPDGLRFRSPPDFYVYDYDWLPNGRGFVAVAAPGDGDSQWWVAALHRFGSGEPSGDRILFRPGGREQLADPVVAPDGRSVSFIGGWMSDQGSDGGDVYTLALDRPDAVPIDRMPGMTATATSIDRGCDPSGLVVTVLDGAALLIVRFGATGAPVSLWSGAERLHADAWNDGISCDGAGWSVAAREDWFRPPELVAGPIGRWSPLTRENNHTSMAGLSRSITWTVDGQRVQGWLLSPPRTGDRTGAGPATAASSGGGRPLVVDVHGGPQAASEPGWIGDRIDGDLLRRGFDVMLPNYRGSFGGGERFAQASIGDIGGGDWRDVLASVDAAERTDTIDDRRVGIAGASYGGYMAMWAVSQTHRFAAAAADAGVSDWLSIEGEAPETGSDPISFGATVYDDPAPYLRASPITHMRGATTPTLITVGDRDVECPAPQSQEFATALAALGVPHAFVVYPGEGHGFSDPHDEDDLRRRTVDWFVRWLGGRRPS